MDFPFAPLLTQEDRAEATEGGLDPLGLASIAESLAVQLVPGVRQRMSNPRYLTAVAVGLEVCRGFDEDELAKDGVSPPWMVFEWLMVDALVRRSPDRSGYRLPGSEKASSALTQGVPLSAKRYLKSPFIFGFHGVYRGLSRNLGVETGRRLGEFGYRLVSTWAREQGLEGFVGSVDGPGKAVRSQIAEAVKSSMARGAVDRGDQWTGWDFFVEHLEPNRAGDAECHLLREALLTDAKGHREETLRFLVSPEGREAFQRERSERHFHTALRSKASQPLRSLLDAIDAYEHFACLCQQAFHDMLHELTMSTAGRTKVGELTKLPSVSRGAREAPGMFGRLCDLLEPHGEAARFALSFASLGETATPDVWLERLIQHHIRVQKQKPPGGKNPWIDRFDDGSLVIRPLYRRGEPGRTDDAYVHAYRTDPLWSFAFDLGLITS